jgi:hypothetical protein
MDLLKKLFGNRAVGVAAIARELDKSRADIEQAKARVAVSAATLANLAVLTDAEHAKAEAEHAESVRAVARLEARIGELEEAHAAALKTEAGAELLARAQAAKRANEADAPKLLAEYETAATSLADVLGKLRAIRTETDAVNDALRHNAVHPPIDSYEVLYRKHPDRVTPEQREKRTYFKYYDRALGVEQEIRMQPGEKVRYQGGTYETREIVVAREHHVRGLYLDSLDSIRLPPGRIGSAWHWPRNT